jgi:hypothetical protein
MNQLYEKDLGADFLADMKYEAGDPPYKMRDDLLRFLAHGGLRLKELFSMMNRTCHKQREKLLGLASSQAPLYTNILVLYYY